METQHGAFDDVSGGALHGSIDGGSLGVLATLRISCIDLREIKPSPEHSFHKAALAGTSTSIVHERLHPG